MHKGIILLIKAKDKNETLTQVKEFMEEYKGSVWDWYVIGGRWSKTLSPFNKIFEEKVIPIINPENLDFINQKIIDEKQNELQKIWESLGAKGHNPYFNHYNLPKDGDEYDILPLSECIDIVKEWYFDYVERGKEEQKKAKERWLDEINIQTGLPKMDYSMYGYCLKIAGNIFGQKFCSDCNVFNVEKYDYSIPDEIKNYFAVMIDIHN